MRRRSHLGATLIGLLTILSSHLLAGPVRADAAPSVVRIVREQGRFHLVRNGKPYFIRGVGGDGSRSMLKAAGGNSIRTWGTDNLGPTLDEAQRLGLTVTAGIWLGHTEQGFDYNKADLVAAQFESARKAVLQYRNHPALLMWALGNEMEGYGKGDDPKIWAAVNEIAGMVKRLDPNHPTMTVVAEVGGNRVQSIERLCPNIDIVGINTYAGGPTVGNRYRAAGGAHPYVVTEFGPPGSWETSPNEWGAALEPTSTAKALSYRNTYQGSIANQPLCLGSYAFLWGHKQETTATWFGMLLPDGERLAPVDTLQTLWTGSPPSQPCPDLKRLEADGATQVEPGATVRFRLEVSDPAGETLKVRWTLQSDSPGRANLNGSAEATPASLSDAIVHANLRGAELRAPNTLGPYRLFAYVTNSHGGAAVANVPLLVRHKVSAGRPVPLPFVLYDESDRIGGPFTASGYMGNAHAVEMQADCTTRPHRGRTCLKVEYKASDNWAGVVWQSPANDWGDRPGGVNLTGAKHLMFWARGEQGGERISFLCGTLGYDRPYFDTAKVRLENVTLTSDWREYAIDLQGKDLTRIKTPFGWVATGSGTPVTFYLDDIRFQ